MLPLAVIYAAILDFRHTPVSNDNVRHTTEKFDPENRGIVVEISLLGGLGAEISLGVIYPLSPPLPV